MRTTCSPSLFVVAALTCLQTGIAAAPASPGVRKWTFAVSLDGKPIGQHDFVVTERGGSVEVQTHAHFKVKALFVPLYHYEHDDVETWREGCLARMDTHTNDNGSRLVVQANRIGDTLKVTGPHGSADLPACVKSFAYWDSTFLSEHRLLNAQTGEYQTVSIADRGHATLQVAGHPTETHRYELRGGDFKIDLWYGPDGKWVGLESLTSTGRTLHYQLE